MGGLGNWYWVGIVLGNGHWDMGEKKIWIGNGGSVKA